MDVFAIVRRTLWGIVLATLLFIGCAYVTIADTLLSPSELTAISKKAEVAKTLQSDIILPRIIAAAQESDYSHLLDKPLLTSVFNKSIPDSALEAKFAPAISATRDWLDSKEPSITFTIESNDLSERLTKNLEKAVSKKIASLPACTNENSLTDAETGVCNSPYISDKELKEAVKNAIEAEPALQLSTITNEDIVLPLATKSVAKNLPEYINILYAVSLLTSGLALIISLWLMSKHRLNGFVTIGGAGLLLALGLVIVGFILPTLVPQLPSDELVATITTATVESFQKTLQREAFIIAGASTAIVVIFGGMKLYFLQRQSKRHTK